MSLQRAHTTSTKHTLARIALVIQVTYYGCSLGYTRGETYFKRKKNIINILIRLLIAIIVFFVAQWLIALTPITAPLNILLAVAIALVTFWQAPTFPTR